MSQNPQQDNIQEKQQNENDVAKLLEEMRHLTRNKELFLSIMRTKLEQALELTKGFQLANLLMLHHTFQTAAPFGGMKKIRVTEDNKVSEETIHPRDFLHASEYQKDIPHRIPLAHLKILLDALYEFDDTFAAVVDSELELFLTQITVGREEK